MAVVTDLATLVGHLELFRHDAKAIFYDEDSSGDRSVFDVINNIIITMPDSEVLADGLTCDTGVTIGSVVYMDASLLKPGDATDISTARVIGVVVKEDSVFCGIRQVGPVTAYTGLVPGNKYFLSTSVPGGLQATPPTGSGEVVHSIGIAVSSETLYINTNIQPTIRS